MLLKYTCGSKWQTLRIRYPFQSIGRPISHRNGWSFRVYMIPLRDFVPEWNSRPGTRTGVNSRRDDSRRNNILWWYHGNKYRATRGNRSELAPGRKSPRFHVNTPLIKLLQKRTMCLSFSNNFGEVILKITSLMKYPSFFDKPREFFDRDNDIAVVLKLLAFFKIISWYYIIFILKGKYYKGWLLHWGLLSTWCL